jgi:hypothetical protein
VPAQKLVRGNEIFPLMSAWGTTSEKQSQRSDLRQPSAFGRSRVERFFNRIKQCLVATRYDRRAETTLPSSNPRLAAL